MMNLELLRVFVCLARHQNLPAAARELHVTASAVSKALQRLEESLQTTLFDREGRRLVLNGEGERLQTQAAPLLALAEQVRSEFLADRGAFRCRVAGPALLSLKWGREIARALSARYPHAQVGFGSETEDSAVAAVARGDADLALVTRDAAERMETGLAALDVGVTRFQVAIGATHPLARQHRKKNGLRASVASVLAHDFVCPTRPPFRALSVGPATDGWRDDVFPRRVRYRSDDLLLVDGLVRAGIALAYLPDYVLPELGLDRLEVHDCTYRCEQRIVLVHRPTRASGWMHVVLHHLGGGRTTRERASRTV